MLRRLAFVAVLLSFGPATAWAQADEALQKKVNAAIDKGVAWLKGRQLHDGDFKGTWGDGTNGIYGGGNATASGRMYLATTVLSMMTLLRCGVDPDDACIKDGLAWLEKELPKEYGDPKKGRPDPSIMGSTYEGGILLMMVEALYDARTDKKMVEDGKDPKRDARPPVKLDDKDKALVTRVVSWLKQTQSRKGGWRYGAPVFESPGGIEEDPSASQIVLLGLTSAKRLGVDCGDEAWMKAATWYLEAQEKDGPPVKKGAAPGKDPGGTVALREGDRARGWPYLRRSSDKKDLAVTGSMTACGVNSLILCTAALAKSKIWSKPMAAAVDRGIYDGLAWIDLHYTVTENPQGWRSLYYYLYGLERLGTLGGFEKVGSHAWYPDGAEFLLGKQAAAGSWNGADEIEPCDIMDTCFALLFLKRATVPVGVTLTR